MNTSHYSSFSLMALLASISLGTALADSTDDALNQFYVENMASRLTSEAPAGANEEPPSSQKAETQPKTRSAA
jgi:hypothetical protein